MAARINTRFLLLLIVIVGGLGAAIGGFVLFGLEKSAADHLETARQLRASKAWVPAKNAYMRAIGVEPTNREAIDDYRSMLLEDVVPGNATEAAGFLQDRVQLLSHEAQVFSGDAAKHEAFLAYIEEISRSGMPGYAGQLREGGENMRDALAGDEAIRGAYYEGLGLTHPAVWAATREEDQRRGIELLREYVEARPEDGLGHLRLVQALGRWAQKADGREQELSRIEDMMRVADRASAASDDPYALAAMLQADMFAAVSGSPSVLRWIAPDGTQIDDARTAARMPEARPEWRPAVRERLQRRATDMVRNATARIEAGEGGRLLPLEVTAIVRLVLPNIGVLADDVDPAAPIRALLERDPSSLALRLELADLLRSSGRADEAIEVAESLLAVGRPTVGIDSVIRPPARIQAIRLRGEAQFARWDRNPDDEALRAEAVREVDRSISELQAEAVPEDDVEMLSLAAVRAWMADDSARAAALHDRLVRERRAQNPDWADPDVLWRAGRAFEQAGQPARALDYFDEMIARSPGDLRVALRRVAVLRALERFREAEQQLVALRRAHLLTRGATGISEEDWQARLELIDRNLRTMRLLVLQQGGEVEGELDERDARLAEAQRAYAERRYDAALDIALRMVAAEPDATDPPMATAIAIAVASYDQLGRLEEARDLIERGLRIAPGISVLQRARIFLDADDEIEAAITVIEQQVPDPDSAAVLVIGALSSLVDRFEDQAADVEAPEQDRATARRLAERARTELDERRARAEAMATADPGGPVDRALARRAFEEALANADFAAAEAIVAETVERDLDQCGGALFDGRLLLQRARAAEDPADTRSLLDRAIGRLETASDVLPFSAEVSLNLGRAFALLGDPARALVEIDRAYRSDPNDREVVVAYREALRVSGDVVAAAAVAARAARSAPGDVAFREAWLNLERSAGRIGTALGERRRIRAANRRDVRNLVQLADLLATTRPDRASMLDDDGNERFTVDRWQAMSTARQNELVVDERRAWDEEWDRVIGDLLAWRDEAYAAASDPEEAWATMLAIDVLRAVGLRALGRSPEALSVLKANVASAEAPLHRVVARTALARHHLAENAPGRAEDALKEAVEIAPAGEHTPLVMLAEMYGSNQVRRYPAAIRAWQALIARVEGEGIGPRDSIRLLEVSPGTLGVIGRPTSYRRLLTAAAGVFMMSEETLADAEAILDRLAVETAPFFEHAMAVAELRRVQANIARGRGEAAEVERLEDAIETALVQAESLAGDRVDPQLQRVELRRAEWARTGDGRRLREALEILSRAATIDPGSLRVAQWRVNVLKDLGDLEGVVETLRGMIVVNPESAALREQLVSSLADLGRTAAIRQALEDAVRHFQPRRESVRWMTLLGDFQLSENEAAQAVETYEAAWRIAQRVAPADQAPNPLPLTGWARAQLALDPPGHRAVLRRLEAAPDSAEAKALEADPVLPLIKAEALAGLGRTGEVRRELESSYATLREKYEAGLIPPSRMSIWVEGARAALGGSIEEVEGLVRQLGGEPLDPADAAALAQGWLLWAGDDTTRRGQAVVRAAELIDGAIAALPAVTSASGDESGDAERAARSLRAQVWNQRALLDMQRGRYDQAATSYERVIEAVPTATAALNNAAFLIATHLNDPDRALPYAQRANQLASGRWEIVDTFGRVLHLSGRTELAEQTLRRSISLRRRPENLHHMALLMAETGRSGEAAAFIEEAVELLDRFDDIETKTRDEILQTAGDLRRAREQGG